MGNLYGPFMDSFWIKNIIPIIILLLEMATQNIKLLNGYVSSTLQPTMDGMANLGSSSLRFNSIFANTVVGSVSDPQIETNTLLFPFTAPYTHRLTTSANTITLDNNAGGNIRATILGDLTVGNSVVTPTFQGNLIGNSISLTNGTSVVQFNRDNQTFSFRSANTLPNRPGIYIQDLNSVPFQSIAFNARWTGTGYVRDDTTKFGWQILSSQTGVAPSNDTFSIRAINTSNTIVEMQRWYQGNLFTTCNAEFFGQTFLAPRFVCTGNTITDALLTEQSFLLTPLYSTSLTIAANVLNTGSCCKFVADYSSTGTPTVYFKLGGFTIATLSPPATGGGTAAGRIEVDLQCSGSGGSNNLLSHVIYMVNGGTVTVKSNPWSEIASIATNVPLSFTATVQYSSTAGNSFNLRRVTCQPFM